MSEISRPLDANVHLKINSSSPLRENRFPWKAWEFPRLIRWSAYLLIIGFCFYRLSIFRPVPLDDSSGALRPLLFGWFLHYLALFANRHDAIEAWNELCIFGLLSLAIIAAANYAWRENLIRLPRRLAAVLCSPAVFWSLLGLTLLLCRFPVLLTGELNPDESQFLASAEKLFYDPNFFRSVDCGTTGPLNIYPLMLPAVVGLSPDLASSRLIGAIAVFLSVVFLYRAITLVGNERTARLAILPVTGAFALFRHGELVHFSSEHIPFLLVSCAIYQGARVITGSDRHSIPGLFWIGFLASAAYFTKMQAVPIIVAVGAVSFAYICAHGYSPRIWRSALSGSAGVLIPILCIVALCWQGGVLGDFWRTYVRGNMHYANADNPWANLQAFTGYVLNLPEVRVYLFAVFAIVIAYLIGRMRRSMSAAHILLIEVLTVSVSISASAFLASEERSSIYAYIGILCVCAAPIYFLLLFRQSSSRRDPVKWFGLLAVVSVGAALFSVYKPHRYFFHYLLFLYIPLGAVLGYLFVRENGTEDYFPRAEINTKLRWLRLMEMRLAFVAAALVLTASCELYLWRIQSVAEFNPPAGLQSAEGYLIRYLTSPGSPIFVWGWNLNPYFSSGRVPATRDTTTITAFQSYSGVDSPAYVPTPASERLSSIYRKRMLKDLEAHPPELFIDAIGPTSWFLRQREYWGFELIPSIKNFVDQRYVHLIDLYGERFFLRRDLAAKREAEFSRRPLPQLTCSPSALLCSERAITLPTDLPTTNIPAHARIDVEFMPIHDQLGPATIFNTEKTPFSFRGLRLQYLKGDRYHLFIGVGDQWVTSKEFSAPKDKVALLSIELNGQTVTLKKDGVRVDEVHLPRPFANAGGPVTVGSWIGGVDPFSGKVQFVQILDLDKAESRSRKTIVKAD